ncbi:MAG: phytanoyl-CoA dioxygenase family protein [Candidatus Obscuribacterales bacterium]|nr:phytanoyl-CoA dioxygenase family protein [Steroidobacteraceae bacterium]
MLSQSVNRSSTTTSSLTRERRDLNGGTARAIKAYSLTTAAIQQFGDEGFLVLPDLCDPVELAWMSQTLRDLFQRQVGRDRGQQFDMLGLDVDGAKTIQPQIVKPSLFSSEFLRTMYYRRACVAAHQLLGPDAHFSFDHSILKPAGSAAATPWHQDEAHHTDMYFRYRQISFWMPLQNTPVDRGCMRYIPKSHRGPLLPHRHLNNDPRVHAIECPTEYFDETLAVSKPAAAGSCILHDGRTLHSALPNVSRTDRIAYVIAFVGPPLPRERTRSSRSADKSHTANERRRITWLLRGGIFVTLLRRLRQGLRSEPKLLWLKARMLAHVAREGWRNLKPFQ